MVRAWTAGMEIAGVKSLDKHCVALPSGGVNATYPESSFG